MQRQRQRRSIRVQGVGVGVGVGAWVLAFFAASGLLPGHLLGASDGVTRTGGEQAATYVLAVKQDTTRLAQLSFMTGCWRGELGGGGVLEEQYSRADGNLMVGASRFLRGGVAAQFEFSRISADSSGIELLPYPGGRPSAHAFRLTHSAADSAVFEAPEHDFPRRISYVAVAPDSLVARIDGGEGSSQSMSWRMARTSCVSTR